MVSEARPPADVGSANPRHRREERDLLRARDRARGLGVHPVDGGADHALGLEGVGVFLARVFSQPIRSATVATSGGGVTVSSGLPTRSRTQAK